MKILIASDIHGSSYYAQKLINVFNAENAEKLLLLGDILYHGPRNPLPKDYAPQKVAEILGSVKENIICVRGNCDAEVDQMVLPFYIMSESAVFSTETAVLYLTHGHKFSPENPMPVQSGSIVLFGHTHVPFDETVNGVRYINPGSTSLPKNGSKNQCLLFDGTNFTPVVLE